MVGNRVRLALLLAITTHCITTTATAQQYPSRTVRMVVAAPPGGLTDIVARSVAQFLQEKLGQAFVVENIAGASSTGARLANTTAANISSARPPANRAIEFAVAGATTIRSALSASWM